MTQPSFCHVPIAFHGSGGNVKDFGGFFDTQTAKIYEFNNSRLSFVKRGKARQRFVERD
jgi:hypothetical protein